MPLPELSLAARRLYDQHEHLEIGDPSAGLTAEQCGYPWAWLCKALAAPIDPLYDLLAGTAVPWEAAYDIDRCPAWCLPWLGQFYGVDVRGVAEDLARATIKDAPARRRGTRPGLEALLLRHLTVAAGGSPYMAINERALGDAYRLAVRTLADQTDDPVALEAAIRAEQKPGGVTLDYAAINAPTYADAEALYDTYAEAEAAHPTYEDAEEL